MVARAEFLLIDIGNTFTKLQLGGSRGLRGSRRQLPTTDLNATTLIRILGRWRYKKIAMCSVVPGASGIVQEALPEDVFALRGAPSPPERFAGVDLRGYPRPHTLGADRLAGMAGALERHGPGPLLVISLGTAATFDLLDARSRFMGGVIAPGPEALANALHGRTALLPRLARPEQAYEGAPPALGLSTQAALRSAAFHGWRGMVREVIRAISVEFAHDTSIKGGEKVEKCPLHVKTIATGGIAHRLAPDVPEIDRVDPDLTLDGLRLIALTGGLRVYRSKSAVRRRSRTAAEADGSPPPADDRTLPLAGLVE